LVPDTDPYFCNVHDEPRLARRVSDGAPELAQVTARSSILGGG